MNDPTRMNNLARWYLDGIWVSKDENIAFLLYLRSAEMKGSFGINNLASCDRDGIWIAQSEQKAFELYSQSAELNDSSVNSNLACCYEFGIEVVKTHKKFLNYFLDQLKWAILLALTILVVVWICKSYW